MSEIILETLNLHKNFGGVTAVNSLTMLIEENSITSIIGPNGAGKTTIFNIITGFLPPSQGSVFLKGKDITGRPPYKVVDLGIARTFQNIQLFKNMTVLENIMVGRHTKSRAGFLQSGFIFSHLRKEEKAIRERALTCLEFVGLSGLADTSAGSLPFGHQRLVEIGRAMATDPQIILLDEPASGLNARETMMIAKLMARLREMGITVILVEHDMDLVMEISETVIVINYGKRLAEGTPKEIQENPEVIAAYLGDED